MSEKQKVNHNPRMRAAVALIALSALGVAVSVPMWIHEHLKNKRQLTEDQAMTIIEGPDDDSSEK